jgi:antitoxin Phd
VEKKCWQLQHAKQRLSEVIRLAAAEGPQQITSRGEETAWIISAEDYRKLTQRRESLVEFFERSPHRDIEIPIERRKDLPRKIDL